MSKINIKIKNRIRRHKRIRANISGTKDVPRLSLYKSNKNIYAQLIDDEKGITIVSVRTSAKAKGGKTMTEKAKEAGKAIAKQALKKKIVKIVFDRGGFLYTGKIKAFADGAREEGLVF